MRLLERKNDDEFTLTKDIIDNIPRYAILSHTWGADTEEVTFRDLTDGTGKNKAGYSKIRLCGGQARHDGLQYFWVDTCCIDKSNNTELAEAINSMFRWYRNAAKCYVYLSDVPRDAPGTDDAFCQLPWESAFRKSRWFTRGWTLQELIAPKSVEFFSKYWDQLGNKASLGTIIHEITGIPDKALQGVPLSDFTVTERMSWAVQRETTRKEDQAYSLLGIFDVYMPLIYSEGKEHAFKRLREVINVHSRGLDSDVLRCLPYAVDAPFNSYAKQDPSTCLPNTRVGLLKEIYNWIDSEDERCIFWLNGLAGTGKSTIARTVARRYFEQKRLGASFFFSRGGGDVAHAGKFFTSIAVQLAYNAPSLRRYISEAAEEQIDIANHSLRDQWRQLVLRPLSRLDKRLSPSYYLLIVDALDECDNEDHIRTILQLLAKARSLTTVRLRVLLTSRPEIPIRHGICAIPQAEHQDFVLHNVPPTIVNHDISLFLEYNLGIIRRECTLGADWPGEVVLQQLVLYACGLFIWATTACRFIREGRRFARERLDTILKGSSSAIIEPEKHLNKIYVAVLQNSISPKYSNKEKKKVYDMLKHTLGSLVVLLSPLSTSSLSKLLHLPKEDVDATFNDLYAILDIPEDPTRQLRLHHPSFRDFLLSKDRCGDFWVDEKDAHQILATGCIQLMSQTLKKDICGMHAPGSKASQVESSRLQKCLPPEVQYACLYWVQHLQRGGSQVCNSEEAHRFLQAHLLHWLEALGWMGKASEGIQAILSLEAHIPVNKNPTLHAFIYDAKRFALYNRFVIEQAPLQLYCSALIFAPGNSVVRRVFQDCIPHWIQLKSKVQTYWSAALQTLERHSDSVNSVAFSPNGKLVVSGSDDHTVRLWDATTGAALWTLEGHSDSINSVAFSPNGKLVVSGSVDRTVRLWDAATRAMLQTFECHSESVNSVAFSPDGKQVVSGSGDHTVRLWDAVTGAALQIFEGHSRTVILVAFSPDGKQVVSGSVDGTVQLWDATTGAALQTFEGYSNFVTSVTFSPDGKQVVSVSDDHTVRLWDAKTGAVLQTFEGHSESITSVTFSPDSKQVVSGSWDRTVRLWDAKTGAVLETLEGHSDSVNSVAFSPDGKQVVSGSGDHTVRLWDTATRAALQTLEGYSNSVRSVAFSLDGKQVVSGSGDHTVRLWDTATGAALQTLEGHTESVISVAFSLDGKQIVSGSGDHTVRLWDTTTGAVLQTLEGHSDYVISVVFSPDGKQILSGSNDHTVRLWDTTTGAVLQTLEGHSDYVISVAFSPDGKQILSGSNDHTVRLWDAATGAALQILEGYSDYVNSVAFSLDGKQVMSQSWDHTMRLWDTATGAALQTLEGYSDSVSSVSFLLDGNLLPILHVSDYWIVEGKANILWLPPDYRPTCEAIRDGTVILGHLSGRLQFLQFRQGPKLVV